jgi:hypothetical protein
VVSELLPPELLGDALLPELLGEALPLALLGEELLLPEVVAPCDEDVPELEPWLAEELPELAPPCTLSAESVCWSSCPVWGRFCCCWNCLIALSVFGPILPSTWPTSRPFCCRACWASRISELPAEEDEDDWSPWLPIDEAPWSCEELDDCCAPWLAEVPWSLEAEPEDCWPLELLPIDDCEEEDGLEEDCDAGLLEDDCDEGLDEDEELFPCANATPVESDRMAAAMAVFWKFMAWFPFDVDMSRPPARFDGAPRARGRSVHSCKGRASCTEEKRRERKPRAPRDVYEKRRAGKGCGKAVPPPEFPRGFVQGPLPGRVVFRSPEARQLRIREARRGRRAAAFRDEGGDMAKRKILVLGASYGSLLGVKLALAGHSVQLVCLPAEAKLINEKGAIVRMPVKGREGLVEVNSKALPGEVSAVGTDVDPKGFDLIGLAMQEPQYGSPGVRELLQSVAKSRVPCMSIMNMPPLPYLARVPGVDAKRCREAYNDPEVWDAFDPKLVTLCSPDPQAFRPPDQPVNVLQVRLPTNFKAARFDSEADTAILRELASDVEAARFDAGGEKIELPVKLKVHGSVFVPLAKWAMLMAGNYRCVTRDGVRSIKETVHGDLAASRAVYEWVVDLCVSLGASRDDMVPFEKYANAALSLQSPSSAARALAAGAPRIERVDRLVQAVGAQHGRRSAAIDEIVGIVDDWLVRNRRKG